WASTRRLKGPLRTSRSRGAVRSSAVWSRVCQSPLKARRSSPIACFHQRRERRRYWVVLHYSLQSTSDLIRLAGSIAEKSNDSYDIMLGEESEGRPRRAAFRFRLRV